MKRYDAVNTDGDPLYAPSPDGEMVFYSDLPQWVSDHTVVVGSKWLHNNGNKYEVITISNSLTSTDRYPVTVVYRNVNNGTIWNRSLSDWHRSMVLSEGE
tara:strand:+ start:245 stop:544 length:300 start_codon:yes stop_codon:yes gene_type:complete